MGREGGREGEGQAGWAGPCGNHQSQQSNTTLQNVMDIAFWGIAGVKQVGAEI